MRCCLCARAEYSQTPLHLQLRIDTCGGKEYCVFASVSLPGVLLSDGGDVPRDSGGVIREGTK